MRNKSFLSLMEQLCMILFFAIAATICLQGFAKANEISVAQQEKDHAVVIVQNASETLKYMRGDLDAASNIIGGHVDGKNLTVFYDEQWQPTDQNYAVFLLKITPCASDTALLGSAEVQALRGNTIIFELAVSWQEVSSYAES